MPDCTNASKQTTGPGYCLGLRHLCDQQLRQQCDRIQHRPGFTYPLRLIALNVRVTADFEDQEGGRSAAKLLSYDEARRIAANIAKLPKLLKESRPKV